MARRYEDMGNRLVQVREALGISQAELCRAIGVKPPRYSQYESGERQITITVAKKLREKYGITLDWVYVGDPSTLPNHLVKLVHKAA